MADSDFSHVKLVPIVRGILEGEDLGKMTPKIVRERLLRTLGNPVINDATAFKGYVRSALSEVLATSSDQAKKASSQPKAVSESVSDTVPDKPATVSKTEPSEGVKSSEDVHTKPSAKKQKSAVQDADTAAKNIPADKHDAAKPAKALPMKRARPSSSKSEPKKVEAEDGGSDGAMSSDVMSSGDDERVAEPAKRKRRQRVEKNTGKGTKTSADDKKLEKLNGALRALGLRMPVRQLMRKTSAQKCDAILQFLQTKDIDTDPTLLSRRELAKHRKRLETEKELLGIDTKYVIYFIFANYDSFLS